ncbi:DUF4397 domain-containing protein [Pedobacter panaciterrae]|uniref:DUF4397 domain-containing protein n=1 Tax=Pedobacter panaciterrae TaxID=363849 RepID=A0ABU8NVN2_9SPHI
MNIFKNETNKGLDVLFVFLMITLAIMLFSSCKKEAADTTGLSSLTIINASPTLATYNAYLDGTKVIESALPFGGVIPYATLTEGDHTLKFTAESDLTALLSKTIAIETNKAYSFFVINKNENMDGLLISDTPDAYSTEKAFIRFVNLSPDAPALDLSLNNDTTNLVTDKSYKAVSSFTEITPGTYSLDTKNAAEGTVMSTLSSTVLTAGQYYTVMAIGLVQPNDVGESFKLQIYIHK